MPEEAIKDTDVELDVPFDEGIDIAKDKYGALRLSMDTPEGHATTTLVLHPKLACKLRDWLNANYPLAED